ncbi:predicted protein [Plenodomus lingam JN3]|uniref:Uncharacterized protein n=1 Tax=Leptosphaeria maculans (strain JN3 / isolate v23.1.3 / race Av1-4-5-6-7-8) TaxID=985895 RepID=E4ZGT0_LEPMJ|nr:predicted protein [Plenodomus lingam JN3]CBX90500.1 predicted protein [Plenodomus lingam JN3]
MRIINININTMCAAQTTTSCLAHNAQYVLRARRRQNGADATVATA